MLRKAAAESAAKTTARLANTKAKSNPPPAPAKPVPPGIMVSRRDQKREELSRLLEERRQQRAREQRNRRIKRWGFIGVPTAVVLIGAGILLYNLFFGPQVAAYLKGDPIDGIACNAGEQLYAHYHAHLQLYVDGQDVPIPTDVGRQAYSGCYYWLHTHPFAGDGGVIHIESPDSRAYDLQEFFDIWGQPFSATNLLGHKVDASHKLTAYVYAPTAQPTDDTQPFTVTPPSNLAPYTGDVTRIILKPHELIVLEYGTPVVPPTAFIFIAGE